MPDLGEGLEDATITGWSVARRRRGRAEPDAVHGRDEQGRGRDSEPVRGRVVELGGAEGETLAVGAVLVRIATAADVAQNVEPPKRKPVLVGYGADDAMDAAGDPLDDAAAREAAGAQAGRRTERRPVGGGGLRPGRHRHARGRAVRRGPVGAEPGYGGGARRAGRDGPTEWRCRAGRYPMHMPACRSTAPTCWGCVTGCAKPQATSADHAVRVDACACWRSR